MPKDDIMKEKPSTRASDGAFDLEALEKTMNGRSKQPPMKELEGYTPLSFDFDDEPARPTSSKASEDAPFAFDLPMEPQEPEATASFFDLEQTVPPKQARQGRAPAQGAERPAVRQDTPFFDFEQAAPQKPAQRDGAPAQSAERPAARQDTPFFDFEQAAPPKPAQQGRAPAQSAERPAARQDTPFFDFEQAAPSTSAQRGGAPAQNAERPAASGSNAAPFAVGTTPAAPKRDAAGAPPAVAEDGTIVAPGKASAEPRTEKRAPAAAQTADRETPQRRQPPLRRPGARPISKIADSPTITFSLNNLNVEAPTLAFMPISDITAAARAEAEARAKQAVPPPAAPAPLPQTRAARLEKEQNVGAAVFSALMDAPEAPTVETDGAERDGTMKQEPSWPAPPRAQTKPRGTPQPIDWNASLSSKTQRDAAPQPGSEPSISGSQLGSEPPISRQQPENAQPRQAEPAFRQPQQAAPSFDMGEPLSFDLDDSFNFDFSSDGTRDEASGELLSRYSRQAGEEEEDEDEEDAPARPRRGGGGSGRKGARPKALFWWIGFLLIALLIILYFVFFGDRSGGGKDDTSSMPDSSDAVDSQSGDGASSDVPEPAVEPIPRDEWYMVLANREHPLSADFAVAETKTVGKALVDARIAEPLQQMVDAAAAAGIQLLPTNGYRTVQRQQELWNARVQKLMTENGLTKEEAEVKALDYTSMAGASDHNTGLGMDIVSQDHQNKDEAYAATPAAQWLVENAAAYGFILRYPSDKTAETGMDYEPWHYRYVGVEQARKIKESGLCLEEYLAQP